MIELAVGALIVALIAGALGFTGVARGAATVFKVVFGIFVVGALILFLLVALGISIAA
jgi:uncharacterized membrane protein YtjA (UPF0391 family)